MANFINLENRNKKLEKISINGFNNVQVTQAEMDHLLNIVDDINILMGKGTVKGKIRKSIKEKFNKIL